MAQVDPIQSGHAPSAYADYSHTSGTAYRTSGTTPIESARPTLTAPTQQDSSLLGALSVAADRTAATISHGTRQSRAEIHQQLTELIKWLDSNVRQEGTCPCPPVVAREYVTTLRTNFLAELQTAENLKAKEIVRALIKLDEAEEAWKRTDRGKFIARLTGADCADAVVAIAHDIRSPLGSILLLVDALRRAERSTSNPVRERQLGLIYGAAFGLSTTVSNLIAAARGDGLVQGTPSPFSVSEMMHSVSDIVQPMCEEKGIPLGMEFPDHDARLGYASGIQQSLLNLTSNALRYTDAGSVAMGCSELGGDRVEFWVEDTGPGVPDEVLERLCYGFPPEGVKLRFSSAGLGLAIVRTLVEAMSSSLQVDSDSSGTRFSFVLALPILR
ncbi:MAG TPA: HAMP domain-containing sensor histidine kinase [Gemmatimonadaceae bacterium]|nr:HAMP domain-containing sensor histidine kinase [Gemmatimonadaceae bacterium]